MQTPDSKEALRREHPDGFINYLLRLPFRLVLSFITACVRQIRPLAPQLIPLTVFILALPVVLFLSVSAGWFVWRSVAVGWEAEIFLQYGDGVPPHATALLPPFSSYQPYDVSLHLVVPASQTNYELGNFMTTLTLSTLSNRTIVTSRKPAIVLPPSRTPLTSLIYSQGTVEMGIPLLSSYSLGVTNVVAHVELGRADQWRTLGSGQGRELSVLSGLLRGVVVHRGFRGIITRFPLFTAVISSGIFLFISFIVLASCLLPAIEWRFHSDEPIPDAEISAKPQKRFKRYASESSDWDEKHRKSKSSRRSRSATTPRRSIPPEFKMEEADTAIPSSSTSSTPLRRRRSRLSEPSDADV